MRIDIRKPLSERVDVFGATLDGHDSGSERRIQLGEMPDAGPYVEHTLPLDRHIKTTDEVHPCHVDGGRRAIIEHSAADIRNVLGVVITPGDLHRVRDAPARLARYDDAQHAELR